MHYFRVTERNKLQNSKNSFRNSFQNLNVNVKISEEIYCLKNKLT